MGRAAVDNHIKAPPKPADRVLLMAVVILLLGGCWVVFDSSYPFAVESVKGRNLYFFLERHLMWAAVGTILMIAAASLPLRAVRLLSTAMISLALCLMVLVLYKGEAVYGAKRWINIGPVSFQPSEMLKVALVVYLASAFSRVYVGPDKIKRTKWVFPLIVGSIAVTLTLLQKDVGTAALLVMTMFATSFAAGARVSKLVIAAFGLLAVFWLLLFTPITQSGPLKPIGDRLSHTKSRLVAYRDPWGTQQNEGYQIAQSLIGLGTGGWFGKGLCNGKVKLMISQSYNDFAVVTLAEESGFVAMIILLGAFVVLTYRGLEIASMSKSRFGTIMAAGLTSYITCQVLVNMAVITASIPVTGVPMPFISYGGTALMFTMAAVGLILAVSRRDGERLEELVNEGSTVRRRHRRTHISGRKYRSSAQRTGRRRANPVYR